MGSRTNSHITIKVQRSKEIDVVFRIKRDTPLEKLMSSYNDRFSLAHGAITFLFDGRTLRDSDTPRNLGMEDQDVVDAIVNVSSSSHHRDVKVKKEIKTDQVIIKVVSQKENEVLLRMKRDMKLGKLMKAYCDKVGAEYDTLRFFYKGDRLGKNDTPDSLEMEDEDEVDVFNYQDGGGTS